MLIKIYTFLILLFIINCKCNIGPSNSSDQKISIAISTSGKWMNEKMEGKFLKNRLEMKYLSINEISIKPEWHSAIGQIKNGMVKWEIFSDDPLVGVCWSGIFKLISPGDSISVFYRNGKPSYVGKGFKKIELWDEINKSTSLLVKPGKENFSVNTLKEYLAWDKYATDKLTFQITIIDSFKSLIPQTEYEYLLMEAVSLAELDRLNAFGALQRKFQKKQLPDFSVDQLCELWDSTQYRAHSIWLRSQSDYKGSIYVLNLFNEMEVWRKFRFDYTNDSLNSKENRAYLYYSTAKQNYKGLLRERLIAYILAERVIYKMDVNKSIRSKMLQDYYAQPEYPQYKTWIKTLEKKYS